MQPKYENTEILQLHPIYTDASSTNPLVVGWYVFHRSESELSNQILIWTGDDCDDYDSFPKIELTVEPKA